MTSIRILLISGSTRDGSSDTQALRALHGLAHPGVMTSFYEGSAHLAGSRPERRPTVRDELLGRVADTDALVFSEYAGGPPGALKNLLGLDGRGGGQLYGKPVTWLDVADPGRGAGARAQLRTVLGYVGAHIVDSACDPCVRSTRRTTAVRDRRNLAAAVREDLREQLSNS